MRVIIASLLLLCAFAYADGINFDCNDLYGNCDSKNVNTPKGSQGGQKGSGTSNSTGKSGANNSNTIKGQTGVSVPSGFSNKRGGFLYSVVFLSALFDNGVQKQGYGILIKDGYILAAAELMNEPNAYIREVVAKVQDDSSNSLMCFAMLRLRASDTKLSLLRAENYTDIYCNRRPESFYHQRINLHHYTPVHKGTLKRTILSSKDSVLFPFISDDNSMRYRSASISNINKHKAVHGLPLFNSKGIFVGFMYSTGDKNTIISSDESNDFICNTIAKNRLLPVSDLTRACGVVR